MSHVVLDPTMDMCVCIYFLKMCIDVSAVANNVIQNDTLGGLKVFRARGGIEGALAKPNPLSNYICIIK